MLMAAEKGNLDQVRSALRGDLAVGDLVDYSPMNPWSAELVPGAMPQWHVLETYPNNERMAAAHLVARRFGMFVPEIEETIVLRGRKVDRVRLLFRGYIFVFVWDILRHQRRIESIPGVLRIMFVETSVGRKRPAVISDAKIDEIRAVENGERPLPTIMFPDEPSLPKKKGRYRKNEKRLYELQRAQWERDNEVVACQSWSPFQDSLSTLDEEGRNQTLRKALGIAA
jgi:transcription antitermination factor NusG